eukprot:Colp12_sorted_trinity150504_noHs@3223
MAPVRALSAESVINHALSTNALHKTDDIDEIKKKLSLLEGDRKAYYENSQFTIKKNKDLITTLRVDNKDLRNQIMKFLTSEKSKKHENPNLYIQNEIEKLETTVNTQRRRIDEILSQAQDYQLKLEKLDDEMRDLRLDETQLADNTDESECAKRVRQLENRLDKALIKYHESMTIRSTYETLVRRLQEERLAFDNQLAVVEGAIKSKRKDMQSVEEMARDAYAARDLAKDELSKFEHWLAEDRKMRDKELQEKKAQVKAVRESAEKVKEREKRLKRDANVDDSERGKSFGPTEEEEEKISTIEDAFRKIKDATGVTDINEVVEKFAGQEETRRQLEELQRGSEQTLAALREERARLSRELEDLKYSGEIQSNSRRVIDDFERHVVESERKEREAQDHLQRLSATIVDVRAAIHHFSGKLQTGVTVGEDLTDSTCVAALEAAEESLLKMIAKIDEKKYPLPVIPAIYPKEADHGPPQDEGLKHVLPPHNLRVRLPDADAEEVDYGDEEEDEEGGEGAQEEEVPSRASMKKLAASLIDQKTKKKTKKTKKAPKK